MKNITLIGSGNVATHLGLSLINKGYKIKQVWSKEQKNADLLAKKVNSESINNLNLIKDADLYIVAVKDDVLESVIKHVDINNIVHTSASKGIEIFKKKFKNYGVLYPLQTFNKEIDLDFSEIPICIEANNSLFERKLLTLGNTLSNKAIIMNSEQRKQLHIGAVFACNFTTEMFSIAYTILTKSNIDFKLLLPLINQTVKKIKANKPSDFQTGPAKRKDQKIIDDHINQISNKQQKEIYKLISDSIIKNYD